MEDNYKKGAKMLKKKGNDKSSCGTEYQNLNSS